MFCRLVLVFLKSGFDQESGQGHKWGDGIPSEIEGERVKEGNGVCKQRICSVVFQFLAPSSCR